MSDFVPFYTERPAATAEPATFAALTGTDSAGTAASSAETSAIIASPATSTSAVTGTDTCGEIPRVTLVRDNDQVVRIVVECPCGRKVELNCVY